MLQGFVFVPDRSSWTQVKGFKDNVEIEVAATYASAGRLFARHGAQHPRAPLYLHYSIGRLPETGYQPRLADDRVAIF